jgi:hypothetical protein
MKNKFLFKTTIAVVAGVFLATGSVSGQTQADRKALLNKMLVNSGKIPARQNKLLSSGMQNLMHLTSALNAKHSKAGVGDDGGLFNGPTKSLAAQPKALILSNALRAAALANAEGPGETIRVSNPALDFLTSVTTGFTQSETSSAWCGNTIVAGYNDSGAFLRTAGVNFLGAWSFSSASYSNDGGRTFVDIGFLNPGPTGPTANSPNFIAGDPVIACTSPSQFYYTSIFASGQDSGGNFFNGVAINTSSNGGQTWSAPAAAVAKDFSHGIDKPWLAADPTNPKRLYVTYTDFDFSFPTTGTCANDSRLAIELVASGDGGNTWGTPVVIDEECGASLNGVQGSNVLVGPDGKVYVGFEFFPITPDNEIHIRTSADHGKTFGAPVVITNAVVPNGDAGTGHLQGGFRNNEFPQLAIDRTSKASRGTLYVAWSDGRNNQVVDISTFTGTYAYPDILVAKSTDSGQTFSSPTTVSPTPADFEGAGRDQFFPGIAVDKDGEVGVCYYDRREEPDNSAIDRYCSVSRNQGASWDEQRVSSSEWLPLHNADGLINTVYIGDYDALASDFLLGSDGFFGTFEIQTNGNPDVFAKKFF